MNISKKKSMKFKFLSLVLILVLLASIIPFGSIAMAAANFTDLPENHWAYGYVNDLVDRGIVQGLGDGSYGTNNSLTRAEFCTFIIRAMSKNTVDYKGTFSDAPNGAWFTPYVEAAFENGYMKGTGNGLFNPGGNITRQEMALTMANVISKLRSTTAHDMSDGYTLMFKDSWKVDAWAIHGVRTIVKLGIMNGDYTGFRPQDKATRAEAAKVISVLLTVLKDDLDTSKPAPTPTPEVTPPEEYGNTSSNIQNAGIMKQDGDTIYFADPNGRLDRMDSSRQNVSRISDDSVAFINEVDNTIFYSNTSDNGHIYKISTNGNGRTKIGSDIAYCLTAYNNTLYYINDSDSMLYKMDLNGNNRTKLNTVDKAKYAVVDSGWIYFSDTSGDLKRVRIDGTEEQFLSNINSSMFMIEDGILYYTDFDNNYILKSIEISTMQISTISSDDVGSFNVSNGWIYYCNYNDEGNLYRIKIDGTQKAMLNYREAYLVNTAGNYISYVSPVDGLIYMLGKDGSSERLVDNGNPNDYLYFFPEFPSIPQMKNVNGANYFDVQVQNNIYGYAYYASDISDGDIYRYGSLLIEHGFSYEADASESMSNDLGYDVYIFSNSSYAVMLVKNNNVFLIMVAQSIY